MRAQAAALSAPWVAALAVEQAAARRSVQGLAQGLALALVPVLAQAPVQALALALALAQERDQVPVLVRDQAQGQVPVRLAQALQERAHQVQSARRLRSAHLVASRTCRRGSAVAAGT